MADQSASSATVSLKLLSRPRFGGPDNFFPPHLGRAGGLPGQCGIAFDWIYLLELQ